jgi:ASC-1-like (ASCH) protein
MNIERGEYGEIIRGTGKTYDRAMNIYKMAVQKGLIESGFDDTEYSRSKGKRIGHMLNIDYYDIAPGALLVQYRYIHMHKYGMDIRKEYFLVRRQHGKITVENRIKDKPRIMKLAKSDLPAGGVISAITGKKTAKIKVPPVIKYIGFKALIRNEGGELCSVWDGSQWELNKTRVEAATPDHDGGFYCYKNLKDCLNAAQKADIFGNAREHNNLVIVEVETSGKRYGHESTCGMKICTSRMKVIKIIGEFEGSQFKEIT